jgi:CBS domain-containing protein
MIRILNLSFVQISSIAGLAPLPNIERFIADGSQIGSFVNFTAIQTIRSLSLIHTPISQSPQFLLSAMIMCPYLVSVNGKLVPAGIRTRASKYPVLARKLIDAGWIPEYPCPCDEELTEIASQYNIITSPIAHDNCESEREEEDIPDRFEQSVANFMKMHERLIRAVKKRCGFEDDGEEDEEIAEISEKEEKEEEESVEPLTLVEQVAEVLRQNNIELDEDDLYHSVLDKVDELCDKKGIIGMPVIEE